MNNPCTHTHISLYVLMDSFLHSYTHKYSWSYPECSNYARNVLIRSSHSMSNTGFRQVTESNRLIRKVKYYLSTVKLPEEDAKKTRSCTECCLTHKKGLISKVRIIGVERSWAMIRGIWVFISCFAWATFPYPGVEVYRYPCSARKFWDKAPHLMKQIQQTDPKALHSVSNSHTSSINVHFRSFIMPLCVNFYPPLLLQLNPLQAQSCSY